MNTPLYLAFYDFKQCFDKLWLDEALIALWDIGVKSKELTLINALNEKSTVIVRTPQGDTENFTKERIVKQRTVMGPMLYSVSIAEFCNHTVEGGINIGSMSIKALAFVDDVTTINNNYKVLHNTQNEMLLFSKRKRSPLNERKCYLLAVNTKPGVVSPTLYINQTEVDCVKSVVYLGDCFNAAGNNKDLVEDRAAKGVTCIINYFSICNELSLGIHAIEVLLLMYKSMFCRQSSLTRRHGRT